MSKGLFHCSKCKKHFYDAEATAMHIKDAHLGDGEVLRHPTKRELLLRDEFQQKRITELEAEVAELLAAEEAANAIIAAERGEVIALRKEVDRLRELAMKAFTVVEWVAGEGYFLPKPHYDADDLLVEMASELNLTCSEKTRAALEGDQ